MAANEIHVGDLTTFELTVYDGDSVLDISSATTKQIKFYDPTGTSSTKDASFTTDGTDGVLEWTATAGFLTAHGWRCQAYLVMSGWTGHSDVHKFVVHENL